MADPSRCETTPHMPPSFAQVVTPAASSISGPPLMRSSFKGEPSIIIPSETEAEMAKGFQKTLVGKFSRGRPHLDTMKKFLSLQNYKGEFSFGLIDNKHVFFRFKLDEDYIRLFSKPSWYVGNKLMRIFKWTVDFHIDRESSIVPVWFSLPKLPIHLTNKEFIFDLMEYFGKPLRLDSATTELRRPSLARVQVEVDVLRSFPKRIWIQKENGDGFWQLVCPEGNRPAYCTHCWHMGHFPDACIVKNPNLAPMKKKTHKDMQPSQVYVVKSTPQVPVPSIIQPEPMNMVQPVLSVQEKDANSQGTAIVITENEAKSLDLPAENLEVLKVVRQDSSKPTASPNSLSKQRASASHDSPIGTNALTESLGPSHATTHTKKTSSTIDTLVGIQLHENSVENKNPSSEMLLRPIIYDKNSPKLAKHRFLKNMGRSSDTESNKARVEKEHQNNNEDDDIAFYTEEDDNCEEQVPFNEEEPGFIPFSHGRKGKNKSQNTASLGVRTRTTKATKQKYDDFLYY